MLGAVNSSVLSSLVPVVLLIGAGFLAGRRGWVTGGAVRDLSNLIFLLLAPALLFRTMSTVHVEQLKLGPVAAYFLAAGLIFAATLVVRGFNRSSAVIALANTFSNTVMIGIPLIGLAFGPEGMVVLLTLISLHSLVLLTSATLVLELAVAREQARQPGGERTRSCARSGAPSTTRSSIRCRCRSSRACCSRRQASACPSPSTSPSPGWARPSARSRW
jgi:malonate transporter